ncbi:hypothetical protein [Paenibacillus pseudetheri]|uniref:Uncharacterized protein n=1 Tax=Paenibacillus pseudetheri TaxID=2897682 RepID=A0ABM9BBM2_9BACL|nr:hypothetical protein [Paenibacillus pseudetheri]CAH1055948.1 hypothetical protein PAECIP111894_02101 [Paenibacillus pseudetheri]
MKGRQIYFSAKEIDLINSVMDYGNASFEGAEDEEDKEQTRASILSKTGGTIMISGTPITP